MHLKRYKTIIIKFQDEDTKDMKAVFFEFGGNFIEIRTLTTPPKTLFLNKRFITELEVLEDETMG